MISSPSLRLSVVPRVSLVMLSCHDRTSDVYVVCPGTIRVHVLDGLVLGVLYHPFGEGVIEFHGRDSTRSYILVDKLIILLVARWRLWGWLLGGPVTNEDITQVWVHLQHACCNLQLQHYICVVWAINAT